MKQTDDVHLAVAEVVEEIKQRSKPLTGRLLRGTGIGFPCFGASITGYPRGESEMMVQVSWTASTNRRAASGFSSWR